MATKSMLKSIDVKEKHFGRNFVSALENASEKKSKEVIIKSAVRRVKKNELLMMFGAHK